MTAQTMAPSSDKLEPLCAGAISAVSSSSVGCFWSSWDRWWPKLPGWVRPRAGSMPGAGTRVLRALSQRAPIAPGSGYSSPPVLKNTCHVSLGFMGARMLSSSHRKGMDLQAALNMDPLHPQCLGLDPALLAGPLVSPHLHLLGHGLIDVAIVPCSLAKLPLNLNISLDGDEVHCLLMASVGPPTLCISRCRAQRGCSWQGPWGRRGSGPGSSWWHWP